MNVLPVYRNDFFTARNPNKKPLTMLHLAFFIDTTGSNAAHNKSNTFIIQCYRQTYISGTQYIYHSMLQASIHFRQSVHLSYNVTG